MPDLNIADERVQQMAEDSLGRVRAKIKDLDPKYEEAIKDAGGSELSPKVQALVDAVLDYDLNTGPHGAIWRLAKAHTIAMGLVAPTATIEEHDALKRRETAILEAMKNAKKGGEGATEKLAEYINDETGRPLQ